MRKKGKYTYDVFGTVLVDDSEVKTVSSGTLSSWAATCTILVYKPYITIKDVNIPYENPMRVSTNLSHLRSTMSNEGTTIGIDMDKCPTLV